MSKFKEIIEGWKNTVFPSESVEKVALSRASICGGCAYAQNGKCTRCGCNLVAKVRSMETKCPLGKW